MINLYNIRPIVVKSVNVQNDNAKKKNSNIDSNDNFYTQGVYQRWIRGHFIFKTHHVFLISILKIFMYFF